jgi:hypothetical protein
VLACVREERYRLECSLTSGPTYIIPVIQLEIFHYQAEIFYYQAEIMHY